VADVNQGLYVLRYQGPHQEQLAQTAFTEGNSNLAAAMPATPNPRSAPAVHPSVRTAGEAAAGRLPLPVPALLLLLVGAAVILLAVAAVLLGSRRWRA
jgi:hypothetical protein